MIAHRVTSPLLFGMRDGSGLGSNKDDMETALKIFNEQVIEPSQRIICECAEEILQLANVSANVFIVMNDEEINSTTGNKTSVEEAQQVLDAAQISSALEIVSKVKEGILTEQQAIIFLIQFLQLPEEVAKSFFVSEAYNKPRAGGKKRWSVKYKKTINCSNPKGFSQKQYCKRKRKGGAYKKD
jgi:hypothetical protein